MTTVFSGRQIEIIEAAGKILTSVGVGGLTTKNLAREMQFSESAIYRHFSSKEAIVIALLNYLADTMDQDLTQAIGKVAGYTRKFEALFHDQFDYFQKNPHFMVAVFSDGLMEESGKVNQAILQVMSVKMKHLKPIIDEGQKTGVFSDKIPCDDLVLIVMGSFRLQMFRWRLDNFGFDIGKAGREMLQSLLKLILK
jgi:AcrR family transcriptional regulator